MDANQRTKVDRVQEIFVKGFINHEQLDAHDPNAVNSDLNRLVKLLLKVNALIGVLKINNVIPHILNLGSDWSNDILIQYRLECVVHGMWAYYA